MKKALILAGIVVLAACGSPTEPEPMDIEARLGCVRMAGTDRWQCDSWPDAQEKIDEVGIDGGIDYNENSGKYVFLQALCEEDCT